MDRTGWVRGGDRSAGQPMQRSGWIRAARYIAESFWRSVIVACDALANRASCEAHPVPHVNTRQGLPLDRACTWTAHVAVVSGPAPSA